MVRASIITTAGADEANSAKQAGINIELTEIAVGVAQWEPDETVTALKAEFARFPIASWEDVGTAAKRLQGSLVNVRGESRTFNGDDLYLIPANASEKISAVVVKSSDGATTYTQGTDYTVDAVRAEITGVGGGAIAAGATVLVTRSDWGVGQSEAAFTFDGNDTIAIPVPIPKVVAIALTSPDGNTVYEEGADYTIDDRLSKISRVGGGAIAAGAAVDTSFDYDTPVNEIGIFTTSGTLFSVFSQLSPLTYKSAVVPALPIGYYSELTGLPVDAIDVTIGSSPIALNTVESSLFGLYNLSIQRLAWQIAASAKLADSGIYV
ncbi:MAG: hypothetical protein J7642_21350 [Cyanobacteria bacterium SBC]|nr:hypothetical protein [Cyanobacteria bacterium SBC]